MDKGEIAEAYLRYFGGKQQADRWALETVDAMVTDDPDQAWDLACVLVDMASSDEALAYVAAGPLEELLKKHGPAVIDRVEDMSRGNDRLRLALSGVWISPGDPIFVRWYALMSEYGFADGRRSAL